MTEQDKKMQELKAELKRCKDYCKKLEEFIDDNDLIRRDNLLKAFEGYDGCRHTKEGMYEYVSYMWECARSAERVDVPEVLP